MQLLTAEQMRAIELAAIGGGEVTGLELMERAGRGVVEALFDWRREFAEAPGRAIVLCGPGNNGGDGFVVARLLKDRGWEVDAILFGDGAKLPPDASENHRRWREMGEVHAPPSEGFHRFFADRHPCVVIDALFGTGVSRPLGGAFDGLRDAFANLDDDAATAGSTVVAVDCPSGLCLDSGRALGACLFAHLTVTFHSEKRGHRLADGPRLCGGVRVADIGLGDFGAPGHAKCPLNGADLTCRTGRWRDAPAFAGVAKGVGSSGGAHKYAYGHALILSGGVGKGGAARLAARGALRIGAGLVTLGAPPAAIIENAARLDAVMLARIGDADGLAEALEDKRINTLAMGPGMGVGDRTRAIVLTALAAEDRAVVLDADALTSFRDSPAALFSATTGGRAVLTPHMGEFARLFPEIAARLAEPALSGPAFSKVDAVRLAAARAGCVVLLKGPDTVISDPEGEATIVSAHYERACPWLATAGAGDALTGMIAGLMARGFDPKTAAEAAAWLHQEAALAFGPGLIAEDLPETLPRVFRQLIGERVW